MENLSPADVYLRRLYPADDEMAGPASWRRATADVLASAREKIRLSRELLARLEAERGRREALPSGDLA